MMPASGGAMGAPPPMDGPPPGPPGGMPMGALAQGQNAAMGKDLQQKVILTVQQVQAMLQVIGKLPGVNLDLYHKGVQALGIGFKMITQAMPGQGGGGPPPGPPGGMGGPPPGGAMGGPPPGMGGPPPGMGGP